MWTAVVLFLALSLDDTVLATISEGQPSSIYTDCLQRAGQTLRRNPNVRASDETLEWSCVQSYLWQTAAQREAPRNLTQLQIEFLTTLVGYPQQPTRAWQILRRGSAGTRPGFEISPTTGPTRPPFRRRPAFPFVTQTPRITTRRPSFPFVTQTTRQTTRRPTFTFVRQTTRQTTRRPPFTFGRQTTRQSTRRPPFTFGRQTTRPTTRRPPFTFGRQTTRQSTRRPPFTFSRQTTRPTTRRPSFTFGRQITRPTTRRPPFTFGRQTTRTTRRPAFPSINRATRRPTPIPQARPRPTLAPDFRAFLNRLQGTSGRRVQSRVTGRGKRSGHDRLKRSLATIPRKEYRALSDAERNAFHAALNLAKTDTTLSPNVYDFVASLHSGVLANGAHGGPAFLGFHRIYILIMDLVICYFDNTNTVRLPYWDNTLDNELANPTASIMWHSTFAGQGNGFVLNGPFGSWATLNGPSIRRSIGQGALMSKADVDAVLTRDYLTQISRPTADPMYDLESHHGRVHGWMGGDMGSLNTATNDPVFFMHHAFIDCVWEMFRNRQTNIQIDPASDYPNTFQNLHKPTDSIGILPGISNLDTLSEFYASQATCEWPTCPHCGPSRYLNCINGCCVPVLSNEADPCPSCPGNSPSSYNGYQNSYCINGYCDTREWAYIPVQITYNRPPDYDVRGTYGSYPVRQGKSQTQYDIYSPRNYSGPYSKTYRQQSTSSRYTDCGCRSGGASSGSVYLQSYGINYDGYYRESSVVDRRYALSSNTGYVAVRNPRFSAAQSYVSVYDDCGRLCRPTCWDGRLSRYVACSGAIIVTSRGGTSKGYGNTYEEATYEVWDYGRDRSYQYPTYRPSNVYLNYVCDYSGTFPWEDYRG